MILHASASAPALRNRRKFVEGIRLRFRRGESLIQKAYEVVSVSQLVRTVRIGIHEGKYGRPIKAYRVGPREARKSDVSYKGKMTKDTSTFFFLYRVLAALLLFFSRLR